MSPVHPSVATRALVALAVLSLVACSGTAPPATPPAASPTPAATEATASPAQGSPAAAAETIDERADAILADIPGEADWPLEGFGSVWLLAPDSDEPAILRVDPATNEIVATIGLPGRTCQGVTVTDDAVWACTPTGAVRIDPATNAITGEVAFPTGRVFSRLAAGAGSVWAIGSDGDIPNAVARIDPAAMTATLIPLGHAAATIAFGFNSLWVTAPDHDAILRVDPASGAVTEHATGLERPWAIAVGADSLWVTLYGSEEQEADEPTVVRVDPDDGAVLAEIATGAASGMAGGLWATENAVWVRAPRAFLTRIDPSTNQVVETISGPDSAGDVTVAFGSVWATAGSRLTVYRFSP